MPTSLTPSSDLKKLDLTYEQIRMLRNILIDEMSSEVPRLTLEHLQIIEMRLQTLIMAGITGVDEVGYEVNKLKVHVWEKEHIKWSQYSWI